MRKYLLLGVLVLLFAVPLSAAENAKIKLPDGLYMYDSSVQRQKDGSDRVGFEKYFIVYENHIYSSKEAIKKFGISKLNVLFGGNKKYKILLGGEIIGTKFNLKIDEGINNDIDITCDESFLKNNIKEGPAYVDNKYLHTGSAVKCIAVPEKYKETPSKVYNTISNEEIDRISKLVKEKLFILVKNRKEIVKLIKNESELYKEKLELLDKISNRTDELYIGIYQFFIRGEIHHIIFSVRKDNVFIITSNNDDKLSGDLTIYGMLDVDRCGEEELIIEKIFNGMDEATTNLEIYKQKTDGNWTQIQKISWRVEL